MPIASRLRKAWDAFAGLEGAPRTSAMQRSYSAGPSSSTDVSRYRPRYLNERSIVSSIYTRIAIDVSGVPIRHVRVDEQERYVDDVDSALNARLRFDPNIDQRPRSFRRDIVTTLCDKGVAAIVPVQTTADPSKNADFDILSLRVGEIVTWYPKHVKVSLYNEATATRQEVLLEKRFVAIVENPLYGVMNEPNSTLQRLIQKLHLLDAVDEQSGSGKLDLIIQLPYVIKTQARREQADQRRAEIESQLNGSKYGIAYTDGTEKVTQLNRPAENNLLAQVTYLQTMLYGQLGITEEVMNGTAGEEAMINYNNRTIEPILDAIVEAMANAFVGLIRFMEGERIAYFRDPFKLVPLANVAEIADKFTRNEIMTSNEIRSYLGIPPSRDPKADQLVNSNMPQPVPPTADATQGADIVNSAFDSIDSTLDEVFAGLEA